MHGTKKFSCSTNTSANVLNVLLTKRDTHATGTKQEMKNISKLSTMLKADEFYIGRWPET